MQTAETTRSPSSTLCRKNEKELLFKLFDAVKNSQRDIGFTAYASQQANIRNYLWISSLLVTACVAFFVQGDLKNLADLLSNSEPGAWSLLLCFSAFALLECIALALSVFVLGVFAGTGSNRKECTSCHYGTLRSFIGERDQVEELTKQSENRVHSLTDSEEADLLDVVVREETEALASMIDEAHERGERLQKMARLTLAALTSGVASVVVYVFATI